MYSFSCRYFVEVTLDAITGHIYPPLQYPLYRIPTKCEPGYIAVCPSKLQSAVLLKQLKILYEFFFPLSITVAFNG